MDAYGIPHRALRKARTTDTLAMSQAVFDEISDVLLRPRLARFINPELRSDLLDLLAWGSLWFEPTLAVTDCRDAIDNKYLELALAAQPRAIISSDQDLLVLDPWRGIPIVRPVDFLAPTY
jgi:putative PIN family toxin of toxin-antitoxin system